MHDDLTIFYYYLQWKKGIAFHEMSRSELQLRNISIQMKFIYSMEPFTHNVDPLSLVCVADINVAAISAAAPGFSRFSRVDAVVMLLCLPVWLLLQLL